ncbi:MAG: hypothetical protein AVDCRST_MAG15-3173, partial [uncultured Rubellimicrobium sp.]
GRSQQRSRMGGGVPGRARAAGAAEQLLPRRDAAVRDLAGRLARGRGAVPARRPAARWHDAL